MTVILYIVTDVTRVFSKYQFDEWDHALDAIYYDEETGLIMESVTVQGGDVDQIPYTGPDIDILM